MSIENLTASSKELFATVVMLTSYILKRKLYDQIKVIVP